MSEPQFAPCELSGRRVRLSLAYRKTLVHAGEKEYADPNRDLNGSNPLDHLEEFGLCIGIIEGLAVYPGGSTYEELRVRWLPSNLRYTYFPDDLELVVE